MTAYPCIGKHTCCDKLSVGSTKNYRKQKKNLLTLLEGDFISCDVARQLTECINRKRSLRLLHKGLKQQKGNVGGPLVGELFQDEVRTKFEGLDDK